MAGVQHGRESNMNLLDWITAVLAAVVVIAALRNPIGPRKDEPRDP